MSNKQKPEEPKDMKVTFANLRAERLAKPLAQREEEERLWKIESAEAIRSMNAYFEEHGFPFPNTGAIDGQI